MQRSESKIEQCACELIKKHLGIKGSKLTVIGDTAFPDRIFWIPGGKPLLIEFKRPGEAPRPKQLHNHAWLRRLGYDVQVHDNEAQAFQAVVDLVEEKQLSDEGKRIVRQAKKVCALLNPNCSKPIGKTKL